MGLLPMLSLRAFWLSPDGRLGMYADSMLAIMRSRGVRFRWIKNENDGVKVTAIRDGEEYTAEFTWQDAVNAGLTGKNTWKSYPKAMCRARCLGEIFRALCADMGGTQVYSKEELMDMEPEPGDDSPHTVADRAAEENPDFAITPKVVVPDEPAPVQSSTSRPPEPAPLKPAPVPAAAPKPEDPFAAAKAEYKRLLADIRTIIPNLQKDDITKWLGGWFATELQMGGKPDPAAYTAALKNLHDVVEAYPAARGYLVDDADSLGLRMRDRMNVGPEPSSEAPEESDAAEPPIDGDPIPDVPNSPIATTFGWPASTCALAVRVLRAKAKVSGDETSIINALKGFGFGGMPDEDATAMLTLYEYDTDAFLLRRKGADRGVPPSQLLKMVVQVLNHQLADFKPGAPEVQAAISEVMASL